MSLPETLFTAGILLHLVGCFVLFLGIRPDRKVRNVFRFRGTNRKFMDNLDEHFVKESISIFKAILRG